MRVPSHLRLVLFLVALFFLRPVQGEQVVISEIMYNPAAGKPEYLEIWNISRTPLDTGKWHFTDGVTYQFKEFDASDAQAVFLRGGERIIVSAADPAATRAAYPQIPSSVRIFGPYSGALASEGERITLSDRNAVPICTVEYRERSPWPKAADGTGHSLILLNENRMIDDFRVWGASFRNGGSPGLPDTGGPVAAPVRLSEVSFASDGTVEWVELQNTTANAVDAGTYFIASLGDLSDKVPLTGIVPANGFATSPVSFPTESNGDVSLFLLDSENNVLATAELKRLADRPSVQAVYPVVPATVPAWEYLRLTPTWYSSTSATPNEANAPLINSAIVINEIMYDPPSSHGGGEYIELYNRSAAAVDLTGWRMRGGVDYDFPAGTVVAAGGYVVIAKEKEYMAQAYPGVAVLGNWSGGLSNGGDQFRIEDQFGNLVDEVDYRPGGDWPLLAAGQGSSIELIHPDMDNSRASAWRDSNENAKAEWQTYSITGTYRQLRADGAITDYKELHLHLVGDSHVALRNLKLSQGTTGTNIIPNIGVHAKNGSSASGWLMQGTHWASHINDAGELHLISDGHGDNRANRAEIDATAMLQGQTYTLEFEARWVSGKSRLIAQTWDHSFGKALLLPIPNALGTPGAPNSIASATPLPQVDSVLHSPAVPKSTDPVRVTARIASQSPLASVAVVHRADSLANTNAWSTFPMVDDGTAGDAVANDGVYTATLTEHQVNGRIVQFYVQATAANAGVAELPKGGANRPGLWIVDNRTILTASDLRKQRLIIPAANRDALTTASGQSAKYEYDFPRLSNHYFNATFIHNEKDVYYHAELRKAGSPWTRPDTAPLDRGKWKLPGDRLFRNRDKFTFDNDVSGAARHHNRIIRYWLYLLGHPVNENEYVSQTVNTDQLTSREDVEPVDGAMISRNFPDGNNGQLLRTDDEWWFQDSWNRSNRDADWSYKGTEDPLRYHTEWMLRSRENEYDYSSFTELTRTFNTSAHTSEELLNRILDPNLVLMMAAVRGYVYDWDSFTLNRGKNGYMYRKPTDGRWIFLHWDSDLAFQDPQNIVVGSRPGWGTYINKPWNRKLLNYYLTEMLTKLTRDSARVNAWFDAEESSSTAYTVAKTTYTNWFRDRHARIIQEINLGGNSYTTPFNITSPAEGTTTDSAVVSLGGTAPSRAYKVVVDGHPNAAFRWLNQTTWQIADIPLKTGLNTLTLRMLDHEGNDLGSKPHQITKTENAPPVMQLTAIPTSLNARIGEVVSLSAAESYDPDGTPLEFAWSINPPEGSTVWNASPTQLDAVFSRPGIYTISVTGTDGAGASATASREVLVYHAQEFSPMNDQRLESYWTLENINERDNFANSTWYSTQDVTGTLLVQLLSSASRPPHPTAPTHPLITRDLPDSADFALQTSLYLAARQTGAFLTGIYVETLENGTAARYLFGLENGTHVVVKRSTGDAAYINVASQPSTGGSAVLRVRRIGNELHFQRRLDNVWATAALVQTLPEGATATRGGIFVATTQAQDVRVGFDYVALSDTSRTTPVRDHLRITEVMYHPKDPDTVEYIELYNSGPAPLNLAGVYFEEGVPVQGMVLGNEVLAPGEFIVVTNSIADFRARYGDAPRLGGQWTGGNLSNSGERVVLRDADGNLIHDFTYSDSGAWPTAADGNGRSLTIADISGNYTDPANWKVSSRDAGSPGELEVNTAPVAVNDTLHLPTGSAPFQIPALANDIDADGDALQIVEVSTASHGTVELENGILRYAPAASFTGTDSFTYKIADTRGETATATVTLTNTLPVAADDVLHAALTAGTLTLAVLENDSDGDGDVLTITAVGAATHGTTSTDGATISYEPGASFTGTDEFTYTIADGHGGVVEARVTLVNSIPAAVDDAASSEGQVVTINVAENDSDADNDVLVVVSASNGGHGTTTFNGGQITYAPDASYLGEDSFTYTIGDGHGGVATATVVVRNSEVLSRTAAETGGTVPGAPAGSTYLSLEVPSVGDDGTLAWLARARVPGSKKAVLMLIGGSPAEMLFSAGDTAPGVPGAVFKKFHAPVSDDTGRVVFAADLKGSGINKSNGTAIFAANADGSTTVIARMGDAAPGLPGATLRKLIAVDADGGETVFVAQTSTAGQTGVWAWDGTTTQLVASTGKSVTTVAGAKTIKAISVLSNVPGSPGHNRSHQAGRIALRLTFTDKTEGIACSALEEGVWNTKVHLVGSVATGFGGSWGKFGAPALNAGSTSVVHGSVMNGGNPAAIAIVDENGPMEVIRAGDLSSPGNLFESFSDPVANSAGTIAFSTRVSGAGVTKANANRLMVVPAGGEPAIVAAQGQPTAIPGTTWNKFVSYALPDGPAARPLFLATIAGSGVNKKNNLGLWSQNADGSIRLIARTGQPVPGTGSSRVLSRITLLNALTPVQGSARSFNALRSIAYLATFHDGAQAIQIQRLP